MVLFKFQNNKIRKKRRTHQLEESNQFGPEPVSSKTDSDDRTRLQNGPDHDIWIKPEQPSSSSSECSSSGTRSKLNLNSTKYKSIRSNLNNNGDVIKKTKNCAKSHSDLGMTTRTRVCRARSGSNSRQVILGRRMISPGVFEYLVQNH